MHLLTFGALLLYCAFSQAVEYENSRVFDGGNYNVSWAYKNTTDKFYFKVRARATGWVGFGVTKLEYGDGRWSHEGMDSYDVVVGGVYDNGSNYYTDYYTEYGYNNFPTRDEQQDWDQTSSIEENGITTLEYERKRNTSDIMDNVIKPGYMFLVWAYHFSSDEFKNMSNKHNVSGLSERLQLIVELTEPPIVGTPEPPVAKGGASCMILGNLFLLLLAAIFMY